jgi:hypothetical protein
MRQEGRQKKQTRQMDRGTDRQTDGQTNRQTVTDVLAVERERHRLGLQVQRGRHHVPRGEGVTVRFEVVVVAEHPRAIETEAQSILTEVVKVAVRAAPGPPHPV